jgi:hypothetical protein
LKKENLNFDCNTFKIKFFPEWPLSDPNIRVTDHNIRVTDPNFRVTDPNIRVNKQNIWMCDEKILIMKILNKKKMTK